MAEKEYIYFEWTDDHGVHGIKMGELIRCKDCKYYQQGSRNSDDWLWCMMNHHYTDEEKYCAWAERKEE